MVAPIPEFPAEFFERMYAQARREFPNECCGYVLGTGADAMLVECKNRQDQLHSLDPETYTRTAETAYNIGGRELLELVRSFESDKPASMIYHSHPRVGAYFSEEDTRAARAAGYPVDYLVIDAQADEIRESKLFRWNHDRHEYEEIARYPGAPI